MVKRAIVLVPGYRKCAQGEARDQLVRSLRYYTDGFDVTLTGEGETGEDFESVGLTARNREGGREIEIRVFEAYWNDLVPDWGEETPISRFVRATRLMFYWAPGGLAKSVWNGGGIPTRSAVALAIAAIGLFIWYLTVFTVLLDAFVSGKVSLPQGLIDAIPDGGVGLKAAAARLAAFFANWAPLLLLIGIFGVGRLEAISNLADFTKAYLRDAINGSDGIGLRAKTKDRVLSLLCYVHDPKRGFDEVFVVAHSMGGAIAIDALAEFGDGLRKTTLHTWGTGVGALALQEPLIEAEITKFYESGVRINNWIDVVFPRDMIASKVPVPAKFAETPAFPPTLEPPLPQGMTSNLQELHERYYQCRAALIPLLQPAPAPAFPVPASIPPPA